MLLKNSNTFHKHEICKAPCDGPAICPEWTPPPARTKLGYAPVPPQHPTLDKWLEMDEWIKYVKHILKYKKKTRAQKAKDKVRVPPPVSSSYHGHHQAFSLARCFISNASAQQ